jgi:hypothetical protein
VIDELGLIPRTLSKRTIEVAVHELKDLDAGKTIASSNTNQSTVGCEPESKSEPADTKQSSGESNGNSKARPSDSADSGISRAVKPSDDNKKVVVTDDIKRVILDLICDGAPKDLAVYKPGYEPSAVLDTVNTHAKFEAVAALAAASRKRKHPHSSTAGPGPGTNAGSSTITPTVVGELVSLDHSNGNSTKKPKVDANASSSPH